MHLSVLSHFDKFPASWNQLAPLTPIVDGLRQNVTDILAQSQLQAHYETVGYTKRKDVHMDQILERSYQLGLKLRAYAKVTTDHVLLQAVNFSNTKLRRGSAQLVLQRCQRIVQHARSHLAELANYQVTEAEVAAVEQMLTTTEPMTPARNVISGERKTATSSIPELIAQARQNLDMLDDLVESMVTDVAFVDTYFNVRRITNRTARGPQVKDKN